ncbi:phosphotransferase [Roseinatronobacter monicus]|uniref:Phosphotransferase family enzyme n=1 Tax=Roseinatronobacter monicus TaxID=393481 RepID=A0A543KGQ5_9RHOB|nr:phosphotransferase [Roseinatronobacter monicus]TQM94244.1 phosphotransferase family enzyme [Roseinatronobacter monicus]
MIAPVQNFLNTRRQFQALADAIKTGFPDDPPVLTRLIKSDAKGRVAEARWRNKAVIVKQIAADDPVATLRALEQEHDRLRGVFPHRNLHFAAYLATSAAQGLAILPFAPGIRIDEVICGAEPQTRLEIATACAAWLARSMEGQRSCGSFSPDFWIKSLRREIGGADLSASDAALLNAVVVHLRKLAPGLRGGPVPRGPIHSDFSSQNIFWDTQTARLTVFDVQGESIGPISQDTARLLCDLTFKRLRDTPDIALDRGLCAELRAAVMENPELDHPDPPAGFMDFTTGYRQGMFLLGKLDHHLGYYARIGIRNWLESAPCP